MRFWRNTMRTAVCTMASILAVAGPLRAQTENKPVETHKHTNRLINSTSPYLLQHAHNPVNWYPWGNEALERAVKEDKPILVSIGYSSCHWCHVMERESFENEDIAAIMNKYFICIKVDREERPDIDNIYMNAVQMMGGRGGWPLNVFLTPDLKPFYGGTYFPPKDYANMPGFTRVLNSVAETFRDKRDVIDENSTRIADALTQSLRGPEGGVGLVDDADFESAVETLRSRFDKTWGGFSSAPKFPPSGSLDLLMRHYYRTGDKTVLEMITTTLDRMAHGGMYDHLGGGFHRYSVDGKWLVPHFEKMLYDNAQLADVYLKAYQMTGDTLYRRVGRQTLDYVLRDMTDQAGGFHSAEDADSEGEEGTFYVWDETEIDKVLGAEDGPLFRRFYGVTKTGNFEGHNILNMRTPLDKFAAKEKTDPAELLKRIDAMREKMLVAREARERPRKDDKVLADWNGLMISAFARGYEALGDEKYRDAANRAADFVIDGMTNAGRLQHSYRAGRSHVGAMLDDYAFLTQGLIDLYESTFDEKRIEQAVSLAETMIELLWDKERGGFYDTQAGLDDVLVRGKSAFDSAVPAGGAVAVHALLRLSALTGKKDYLDKAERGMHLYNLAIDQHPPGFARLLNSYDFHRGPVKEVVIVGRRDEPSTREMIALVYGTYLPNRVLAWTNPAAADAEKRAKLIPLLEYKDRVDGRPAAYVCHGKVCYAPVTTVAELKKKLAEK